MTSSATTSTKSQGRVRRNILFENFDDDQFDLVKDRLVERHFKAGETILDAGNEGNELYLITEGRVEIKRAGKHNHEKLLALLHPGDCFGELELIDGRPRFARVVAVEDCTAFSLSKTQFEELLQEHHALAVRMMQLLSVRLRALNSHFVTELERHQDQLTNEVKRFNQLIEAAKNVNSTLDLGKLLNIILETALRSVSGDRGTVYLVDHERRELWSKVLKGDNVEEIRLPMGAGIAGYVASTGDTLNIVDAYLDPRFNPDFDKKTGYRTKTILCMPMKNKDGKIIGVFQLLNKAVGEFTVEDQNFIEALSVHAAIAIENARLYEEEKSFMKMQEEMRLAGKIQQELLPKTFPEFQGYEIAGRTIPVHDVGGDYFDFITIDDGRVAVCLGDVTGKGLPASLLMANLQATLRGQTMVSDRPKDCLFRSNKLLFHSTSPEKFATLFYSILDTEKHTLSFSNAGQDNPMLVSAKGSVSRLKTGGIMLGAFDDFQFEDETVSMKPKETLVIYSDGVSEAMNPAKELYGDKQLQQLVVKNRNKSAGEIIDTIIADVRQHANGYPQSDDITVVVVRRVS